MGWTPGEPRGRTPRRRGGRGAIRLGAAALLLAGAPAAAAPAWTTETAGMARSFDVPAGVLPPGPAEAWVEFDGAPPFTFSLDHRVRFRVPEAGAVPLRVWVGWGVYDDARVVVRSEETGAEWTPPDVQVGGSDALVAGQPAFLGPSARYAELRAAVAGSMTSLDTGAVQVLDHLPGGAGSPDCRALLQVPWVVVDLPAPERAAALACAARGAQVVLVGDPPAALRGVPAGRPAFWGAGLAAWAPDIGGSLLRAAALLAAWDSQGSGTTLETFGNAAEPAPSSDSRFSWLVAGLALASLLLLGPVGWLVGRRSRRPALAWGWFPAVSLALTGAVGGAAAALRVPAEIRALRVRVLAPSGEGIEQLRLAPTGDSPAEGWVELPFRDGDLGAAWPGSRFGSPLRRATHLRAVEDREAGRLRVAPFFQGTMRSGTTVNTARPVRVAPPLRASCDGARAAVRAGERPIAVGLVLTGERWGAFGRVEPGEGVEVALDGVIAEPWTGTPADPAPPADWRGTLLASVSARKPVELAGCRVYASLAEATDDAGLRSNLPVTVLDSVALGTPGGEAP